MFDLVVQKTLRVPRSDGAPGDGSAVARQMDAALLGVGFAASRELMDHVGGLEPGAAIDLAAAVVRAVRHLVGDHVQHNTYFIGFPRHVPDTVDFWAGLLRSALVRAGVEQAWPDEGVRAVVEAPGFNLLTLPGYGQYQHSYADLLDAHDALIAGAGDRITVLHLGDSLADEVAGLYATLAGSTVPLGEADAALLAGLAADTTLPVPDTIPMRESRAIINAARLCDGLPLVAVDRVTDVLRIAVALSGGDLTLSTPTRFARIRRAHRRVLLAALDRLVAADAPGKLAEVPRLAERWKRLGVELRAGDYVTRYPAALTVFAVARGEISASSPVAAAEYFMRKGSPIGAAEALSVSPGALVRAADRLLRTAPDAVQSDRLLHYIRAALPHVSGRVLLSLREHMQNRTGVAASRVFVGRSRRAWATGDTRPPLPADLVADLTAAIDDEVVRRLPRITRLVVDPAVYDVAIPLSGRAAEAGFAVLPRGSRTRIDPAADTVRLFTYWRQEARSTDFDLSAAMTTAEFIAAGHVSFTSYHDNGLVHSGDIVTAPTGATEFIDVHLPDVPRHVSVIMPQVYVYGGEDFAEAAESMFGWMVRDRAREGMPFEPRTVATRSDMRGAGRVAMPMALVRDGDGWSAVWMHLYLRGQARFNTVEVHRASAGVLARGIVDRRYLTVQYLTELWAAAGVTATPWTDGMALHGPVVYIGMSRPEGLPEGSEVYTLDRLAELVPA